MSHKASILKTKIFEHFGKHPKQHGNTIKITVDELKNEDFKLFAKFQSEYFAEVSIKRSGKGLTVLLD